ncbi:MAG TPA: flavodoxin family protein [Terriglobales bacterium]|nr:flavodoxin family protein [Terriglobales bacterium]
MKVLAFNSSPKMDKGNTALILNPFLDGMQAAGAEVELFYTSKLNIDPCQGELHCWLNSPGECFQQDDMQMIHPKLREADVLVFATPVYVWGVSGQMKNLMDRLIPMVEPWVELRDGHSVHPIRDASRPKKIVLVSTCGFWELDNFEPLLVQMRMLCNTAGFNFAGALLRPAAPIFSVMLANEMDVTDVVSAAEKAGRELATSGLMSDDVLKVISREVIERDSYVSMMNSYFDRKLARAGAK